MARKKVYKVWSWATYYLGRNDRYCCGTFHTKREAKECLARQYDTPSRTHYIEESYEMGV